MKNTLSRLAIAIGVSLVTLLPLDLVSFTAPAEAGCRPTGRYARGLPILRCTGRTKCRPTGRFRVVGGRRYAILRCPR